MKKWILAAAVIGVGIGIWFDAGSYLFGNGTDDGPATEQTANGGMEQAGSDATASANSGASASNDARSQQVRVRTIAAEPMQEELVLQGRTLAQRTVTIRAEVAGTVEEIFFGKGETVESGESILRLSSDDREARASEARALVRQRQAEFEAARTLADRGVRSSTDVTQAEAALESARAALAAAELAMNRMVVRAPFGGVLDSRNAELGAFLDRGEEVAVIVDLDPLRVRGQVSERNLGDIRSGDTGQVRLVGGSVVEGRITYIGASADDRTRTFPVEIEVPNPDGAMIENLTAEIRIPLSEKAAHRLEASLLSLSDDGIIGVKAVESDGTVTFHPVDILGDGDGAIWVSGLPETVTIITVGQEFVVDGQTVTAVDEADIAARAAQ